MGIQVSELFNGGDVNYIDFTYNGKSIGEFGLVAVIDGDRYHYDITNDFEDETSEVNGVDGQYYWSTRQKAKEIVFSLATDGIDDRQLRALKHHFQPGRYGRLTTPEWPGRYYNVRVSQQVKFDFIPFMENGKRIYKGESSITFIADDPYAYSDVNVLAVEDTAQSSYNGTPPANAWADNSKMLCGEAQKYLAVGVNNTGSVTASSFKVYNPSDVPSEAIITFTLQHVVQEVNGVPQFVEIKNDFTKGSGVPYNKFVLKDGNTVLRTIKYGEPGMIYYINYAIQLAYQFQTTNGVTGSESNFEEILRESIIQPEVMAWAAYTLAKIKTDSVYYDEETGCFINGQQNLIIPGGTTVQCNWVKCFGYMMLCMLAVPNASNPYLNTSSSAFGSYYTYTLTLDGENGTASISTAYNSSGDTVTRIDAQEKNCSDIAYSDYPKIDGGCELNDSNKISTYYTLESYDGSGTLLTLDNVTIEYKYKYV